MKHSIKAWRGIATRLPKASLWLTAAALCCAAHTHTAAQTQRVSVVEYHPAPGQLVNTLPYYEEGHTHDDMCRACEQQLDDGNLIHLGGWGGYVTVKFDHRIENRRGSDFRIAGNAYYSDSDPAYGNATIGGSMEPGVVYVGVGDRVEDCRWYQLAGSEYYTGELHDFRMTYYRPEAESGEHEMPHSTFDKYIRWECSWTDIDGARRDSTGWLCKNAWHSQSYWPLWDDAETMTFTGTRLPDNAVAYDNGNGGFYWVLYRYAADAYGYADAATNDEDYSTFDLDWAVDENGEPVSLQHCDFIRVASGVLQQCGWIGETSTEVGAFTDLHLLEGYDDNPIVITQREKPSDTGCVNVHGGAKTVAARYDMLGHKVGTQAKGLVIEISTDGSARKRMIK